MNSSIALCIPGPWREPSDLIQKLITLPPVGNWMFAGQILADVRGKEHIRIEMDERIEGMEKSFEIAGAGQLSTKTLSAIASHQSMAYLFFDEPLPQSREKLLKFSQVMCAIGGFAVKVESSGIAHECETWLSRLQGDVFDLYRSAVVLIGGEFYYSCGMHHFGLPEVAMRGNGNPTDAADMMNQFNLYRIVERPTLRDGETFSLRMDSPYFRLNLQKDERHNEDDLFHNPYGVWNLELI